MFFKRLKRHAAQSAGNSGQVYNDTSSTRVNKGKSYISDRVIEDAEYVEISGDTAK
jgi:hypothetical protein